MVVVVAGGAGTPRRRRRPRVGFRQGVEAGEQGMRGSECLCCVYRAWEVEAKPDTAKREELPQSKSGSRAGRPGVDQDRRRRTDLQHQAGRARVAGECGFSDWRVRGAQAWPEPPSSHHLPYRGEQTEVVNGRRIAARYRSGAASSTGKEKKKPKSQRSERPHRVVPDVSAKLPCQLLGLLPSPAGPPSDKELQTDNNAAPAEGKTAGKTS